MLEFLCSNYSFRFLTRTTKKKETNVGSEIIEERPKTRSKPATPTSKFLN